MEIAKGVKASDWHKLDLTGNNETEWDKSIEIFNKRIEERYIEPIDILIKQEENILPYNRKFGFAILALDCMLLETLQSFYEGLTDTKNKSKTIFIKFLTERSKFKPYFSEKIGEITIAEKFYSEFRSGILHQTEIGKGGKIWSIGKMVNKINGEIIINRNIFHKSLKEEFNIYTNKLKDNTDQTLKTNFVKKMDYISRKP